MDIGYTINTPVDICNLALSLIKTDPITSFSAPSNLTERMCALWYNMTRKQVLRKHPWNFARSRAILNLDATSPAFGYSNRYALPSDFCRLRYIGEIEDTLQSANYDLEEGFILTNSGDSATLMIGYIKDITNVAKYDDLFKQCFALTLAINMIYGFQGKLTARRDLREMLVEANAEARAVNGQDNPPTRVTRSRTIGARRKYGGGSGYSDNPGRVVFS